MFTISISWVTYLTSSYKTVHQIVLKRPSHCQCSDSSAGSNTTEKQVALNQQCFCSHKALKVTQDSLQMVKMHVVTTGKPLCKSLRSFLDVSGISLLFFFYSSRLWSIWLTQFSLRSHEYDAKRSKTWLTIFFQIWVKAKLSEPCCTVETLFLETVFHYCTSAKHILPVIVTAVWNGLFSLFECNPVTNAPKTNYRWCHCVEMAFCSSSSFWHHVSSYHMTRSSQRWSMKTEWQKKQCNIF